MNSDRYNELSSNIGELTEPEKQAGWHFCPEWDYMLLQMGSIEGEKCDCKPWPATKPGESKEVV